jgi:hypothetical protein
VSRNVKIAWAGAMADDVEIQGERGKRISKEMVMRRALSVENRVQTRHEIKLVSDGLIGGPRSNLL